MGKQEAQKPAIPVYTFPGKFLVLGNRKPENLPYRCIRSRVSSNIRGVVAAYNVQNCLLLFIRTSDDPVFTAFSHLCLLACYILRWVMLSRQRSSQRTLFFQVNDIYAMRCDAIVLNILV